MKYLTILIILIFSSCNYNKKKVNLISTNSYKDSISNIKKFKVDLQEKRRDLSMYNDKYLLMVIPNSTFSKEDMSYNILMTLKSDTIINYKINIDSINTNYYKYNKSALESGRINFKKDYYLSGIKITSAWARAENLYLTAILNSKSDTSNKHISLKFKYLGKEMGKVFLNVL